VLIIGFWFINVSFMGGVSWLLIFLYLLDSAHDYARYFVVQIFRYSQFVHFCLCGVGCGSSVPSMMFLILTMVFAIQVFLWSVIAIFSMVLFSM